MTVGIVAVSHSKPLGEAARDLALQMVSGEQPPLEVAAGTPDGGFGTDAVAVADAITAADSGSGVLVLTDLGSAILSAEMAVEFLPDPELPVQIVAAPFVEGLLAATVRAATGGSLAEVAAEARAALQPKIEQLDDSAEGDAGAGGVPAAAAVGADAAVAPDATAQVVLRNPAGLHARPAAQIAQFVADFDAAVQLSVAGKNPVSALSPLAVAGLGTRGGDEVTVSATGEAAETAVAKLVDLISAGFGEVPDTSAASASGSASAGGAAAEEQNKPQPRQPHIQLGVSPGRVVGPVAKMAAPITAPEQSKPVAESAVEAEQQVLRDALQRVRESLETKVADVSGAAADVLGATLAFVNDPLIAEKAAERIANRFETAAVAVWEQLAEVIEQYTAAGGDLAERARDVRDVRARIVAEITGAQLPGIPERREPFVLAAVDLAPADTAVLDPRLCLGLLLGEGGPTSHTAILARSLGIAAVVDPQSFATVTDSDTVLVDGDTGEVVLNPAPEQARTARTAPLLLSELEPFSGDGRLQSGETVQILANIGGAKDAAKAIERGAQGVGLFRTEFLFLGRDTAPSYDEQVAAYTEVLTAFGSQKVVFRTLDAGSDKPLPFVTPAHENNPAIGVRGYRTSWLFPEVLETQVRAIAAAAAAVPESDPWVMAPMIATLDEAQQFAELVRTHGLQTAGVMVETPAAAILTDKLFECVDFVSIGTNDLTQYTMAADRLATELAPLNTAWQPAVLRMIHEVGQRAAGKPVGVCGEAAADPLLAAVLVGLGVTSLSMSANSIALVGPAVAEHSLATCREAAQRACAAETAAAARQAAAEVLAG